MLSTIVASVCLFWYTAIACMSSVGYIQIWRYYKSRPRRAEVESKPLEEVPHITIIRPVKGVEPYLYECLASSFQLTYPASKLTIFFCVSRRSDPAVPIIQRVLADHAAHGFDTALLVAEEDPAVASGRLGPNPKIQNMSRAYREAKGDIVWIVDCNVWVGKGVCGRLVSRLMGWGPGNTRPNKFVHQLPLVIDVSDSLDDHDYVSSNHLAGGFDGGQAAASSRTPLNGSARLSSEFNQNQPTGNRLEELFQSSSHAKFYTAINTILLAPCIVGKSNMFRRSDLDFLTSKAPSSTPTNRTGIDFFSYNICEDHLIGDLLWKNRVQCELTSPPTQIGKHAMLFGDMAIQPVRGMSVADYIARRVRWLRVRKFTVTLATLVEPGTESLLCSIYGAFAVTHFAFFERFFGGAIKIQGSILAGIMFWLLSVGIWSIVDWSLYRILQAMDTVEEDANTPAFARRIQGGRRRTWAEWARAWAGRELLAFPIWAWAVYGGTSVTWRGQRFRVGMDMRVHALDANGNGMTEATDNGKARQE